MKKKIFLILSSLTFIISFIFSTYLCAFSEQAVYIDYDKMGSVSIHLSHGSNELSGVSMAIYKIADAYDDKGVMNFKYTERLSAYSTTLSSLQSQASVEKLSSYVVSSGVSPIDTRSTDENGNITFGELPLGIYLVRQASAYPGFSDFLPFLIIVPEVENSNVNYNVDATPKIEIEKLTDITVKKKWNDDETEHPAVKVALYKNSKPQGKPVTLNKENNWSYTWKDMPLSDAYCVAEIDIPPGYAASYKHSGFVFTVTNSSTLIKTGQQKMIIPILAVSGILIFLVGLIKSKEEKKTHNTDM